MPGIGDIHKGLKDILEVEERLRARKKELKNLIMKEGSEEKLEIKYANELVKVLETLDAIENKRLDLYSATKKEIEDFQPPK